MEEIFIIPNAIELELSAEELKKVVKLMDELNRLASAGYLYTQTALDIAKKAEYGLLRSYHMIQKVDCPGVDDLRKNIIVSIMSMKLMVKVISLQIES